MTKNPFHDDSRTQIARRVWRYVRAKTPAEFERLAAERRSTLLERLHPRTREVLLAAERNAVERNANRLDTGHLLAGLLTTDGLAADVLADVSVNEVQERLSRGFTEEDESALASIGISLDEVLESSKATFGPDALARPAMNRIPMMAVDPSLEVWSAINGGYLDARVRGDEELLPEHILAALLDASMHEGTTKAAAILSSIGCEPDQIRTALLVGMGPRPSAGVLKERAVYGLPGADGVLVRFQRRLFARIARESSETR